MASAAGAGEQQLVWRATDGRWSVVVMNADATRPVVADLSAAVTAPALRWVWIGLYIGAGVALVIGALLVGVAVPRRDPGDRIGPRTLRTDAAHGSNPADRLE